MRKNKILRIIFPLILLMSSAYAKEDKAEISFGLIADVQYGNCDTKGTRYYKNSLDKLRSCVSDMNEKNVDFSIVLGDLIDRYHADLHPVLSELKKLKGKVYNTTGNHDYAEVENSAELYKRLGMPNEYYAFNKKKCLFIMLNTNEVSSYANQNNGDYQRELSDMKSNIKANKRNNGQTWNGGISARQLKWLEDQLIESQRKRRRVLIFSHHPFFPAKDFTALNDTQILALITKYDCVKGVISGHHHPGGTTYYKGIPFVIMEGMIETEKSNAYAIVNIYKSKIVIDGIGRASSQEINFSK